MQSLGYIARIQNYTTIYATMFELACEFHPATHRTMKQNYAMKLLNEKLYSLSRSLKTLISRKNTQNTSFAASNMPDNSVIYNRISTIVSSILISKIQLKKLK